MRAVQAGSSVRRLPGQQDLELEGAPAAGRPSRTRLCSTSCGLAPARAARGRRPARRPARARLRSRSRSRSSRRMLQHRGGRRPRTPPPSAGSSRRRCAGPASSSGHCTNGRPRASEPARRGNKRAHMPITPEDDPRPHPRRAARRRRSRCGTPPGSGDHFAAPWSAPASRARVLDRPAPADLRRARARPCRATSTPWRSRPSPPPSRPPAATGRRTQGDRHERRASRSASRRPSPRTASCCS